MVLDSFRGGSTESCSSKSGCLLSGIQFGNSFIREAKLGFPFSGNGIYQLKMDTVSRISSELLGVLL
jgi:hypothetical protein